MPLDLGSTSAHFPSSASVPTEFFHSFYEDILASSSRPPLFFPSKPKPAPTTFIPSPLIPQPSDKSAPTHSWAATELNGIHSQYLASKPSGHFGGPYITGSQCCICSLPFSCNSEVALTVGSSGSPPLWRLIPSVLQKLLT